MPKVFYKTDRLTLINDDILVTNAIASSSIDLIVTSPPYNVGIQYESIKDDISYSKYLEFTRKWLSRCFEFLKDDGRLCLNIPLDKNKGGQQSVGADITTIAKQVGFQYHATIVWNEGNISRRTAWGSWMSASAPFVIAPVEWTNGLWTFKGESKKKIGHPTPFPIELPKRCIKLFSFVGDTVLDPFAGSGTTLIAAAMLNRTGIGIEIETQYCELAKNRILSTFGLI